MQLEGKRIIVCGAARGMGKATIDAYVAEGADVVALDTRPVDVDIVGPGKAHYFECDISSREQVDSVFEQAASVLGGLDVLVVTAAIDVSTPAAEISEELLERVLRVNVGGTVNTNQAAYRLMKEQGSGAIVNFGSDSGLTPAIRTGAYAASKGAVHTWTRLIAGEWGPDGIRANAVLPAIWTEMGAEHLEQLAPEDQELYKASWKIRFPLGGKPGDLVNDYAPVMVFLASDGSRFITGQLIPINGGYGMVR
jgi:NAD(P)-dependent dehydrogenase (short-subunit alcohol dehydrogenase family)